MLKNDFNRVRKGIRPASVPQNFNLQYIKEVSSPPNLLILRIFFIFYGAIYGAKNDVKYIGNFFEIPVIFVRKNWQDFYYF